ncbi:MAG: hypothetical protein L6428_10355 [Candidatus Aminicenantes bacterium]|nr:hypothetical protein [Acidobacteriota bacterium]MCG2811844.1 hypothetical protein [Candidatus Aminicenantes bacterium]
MKKHALRCLILAMMVLPISGQEKIELCKDVEVYARPRAYRGQHRHLDRG